MRGEGTESEAVAGRPRSRRHSAEGYAEAATDILKRYEAIPSAEEHAPVLHLLPDAPSRILDIGSGTGRDAAWLTAMGHRVVAAEPTDEPCHVRTAPTT